MLAALEEMEIPFCHLATDPAGGVIATCMLLRQPKRFGRVLALDPVTPLGMTFNNEQIGLFRAMMKSRDSCNDGDRGVVAICSGKSGSEHSTAIPRCSG
jgi:hypothetical protein